MQTLATSCGGTTRSLSKTGSRPTEPGSFTVGWRQAAFISGLVFLLVVPILAYFVRNTPESMGLAPDGDPPKPEAQPSAGSTHGSGRTRHAGDFTAREALRTRINDLPEMNGAQIGIWFPGDPPVTLGQ